MVEYIRDLLKAHAFYFANLYPSNLMAVMSSFWQDHVQLPFVALCNVKFLCSEGEMPDDGRLYFIV